MKLLLRNNTFAPPTAYLNEVLAWREQLEKQVSSRQLPDHTVIVVVPRIPHGVLPTRIIGRIQDVMVRRLSGRVIFGDSWHAETLRGPAAPATIIVVPGAASTAKEACLAFEQTSLGTFCDADVVAPVHLTRVGMGLPSRRCLVCCQSAKTCIVSRRHGLWTLRLAVWARLIVVLLGIENREN